MLSRALFSCKTRFEIRPFASLPTNCGRYSLKTFICLICIFMAIKANTMEWSLKKYWLFFVYFYKVIVPTSRINRFFTQQAYSSTLFTCITTWLFWKYAKLFQGRTMLHINWEVAYFSHINLLKINPFTINVPSFRKQTINSLHN